MTQVSTLQLFAAACIFANYAAHHIAACPAAQSPGSLSHALQRPLLPTGLAAGEHGFFTVVPAVAVHVEPVGAKQSRWNADGELLATNHITGGCCAAVCIGVGLGCGCVRAGRQVVLQLRRPPILSPPLLLPRSSRWLAVICRIILLLLQVAGPANVPMPFAPVFAAEVHRGVIEVFARGVEV